MSLSDLAALGSFVSGFAVVITLVFLLVQMQQTNKNQKSLMQQGRTARNVDLMLRMADPYMSEIMVRAAHGDLSLDASQVRSLERVAGALIWSYEDSFLQFKAGTLEASTWESDEETLRVLLAYPAWRYVWSRVRMYWTGAYRNHVDGILQETEIAQAPDESVEWKKYMTKPVAA